MTPNRGPPPIPLVKKMVEKHSRGNSIDVGGGEGRNASFFNGNLVICDIDLEALRKAPDDVEKIVCDGRELPFSNCSFDFVVSSEVIEHIAKEYRADYLSELSRISNGPIVISAPVNTTFGNLIFGFGRTIFSISTDEHPAIELSELDGFKVYGCLNSPAWQLLENKGLGAIARLFDSILRPFPFIANHIVAVNED